MSKKQSYEAHIEELEQIIASIEGEQISIDDLSEKVKRAAELIRKCQSVLKATGEAIDGIIEEIK
jgi:exodeoxyribonuclease VII small subunit